jgi:hypothetical protein
MPYALFLCAEVPPPLPPAPRDAPRRTGLGLWEGGLPANLRACGQQWGADAPRCGHAPEVRCAPAPPKTRRTRVSANPLSKPHFSPHERSRGRDDQTTTVPPCRRRASRVVSPIAGSSDASACHHIDTQSRRCRRVRPCARRARPWRAASPARRSRTARPRWPKTSLAMTPTCEWRVSWRVWRHVSRRTKGQPTSARAPLFVDWRPALALLFWSTRCPRRLPRRCGRSRARARERDDQKQKSLISPDERAVHPGTLTPLSAHPFFSPEQVHRQGSL